MTTNFTPGPWQVEKSDSSRTGSVHYAIKTSYKPAEHSWSPRFITFMCGGLGDYIPSRPMNDYRTDPLIEADAHLIAAAPDMYEALKLAVRSVHILTEMLQGKRRKEKDEIEAAAERLPLYRAALAKAEGRAQ